MIDKGFNWYRYIFTTYTIAIPPIPLLGQKVEKLGKKPVPPKKTTCTTFRPLIPRAVETGTGGTAKTVFFSLEFFKKYNTVKSMG